MNRLDLNPPPAYQRLRLQSWRYPWLTGTPAAENQHRWLFRNQRNGVLLGGHLSAGGPTATGTSGGPMCCSARLRSTRSLTTRRSSTCRGTTTGPVYRILRSAARPTSRSARMTEWDPRFLPPSMAGGVTGVSVFSKLTAPRAGVIDSNGEAAHLGGAGCGLGDLCRFASGNPAPLTGVSSAAATGADLFSLDDPVGQPQLRVDVNARRTISGIARQERRGLRRRKSATLPMMEWPSAGRDVLRCGQVNTPSSTAGSRPPVPVLYGTGASGSAVSGDDRPGGRSVHIDCPHWKHELHDRRAVHGARADSVTTRRTKCCAPPGWRRGLLLRSAAGLHRVGMHDLHHVSMGLSRTTTRSSRTTTAARPTTRSFAEALPARPVCTGFGALTPTSDAA